MIKTVTANASTVIGIVVAIRRYVYTPSAAQGWGRRFFALTPDYENKPQGREQRQAQREIKSLPVSRLSCLGREQIVLK